MSYVTLEVKIDHGRVVACGCETLPETGAGLLTILPSAIDLAHPVPPENQRRIAAYHALRRSLNLDETKARAWMNTVRDARR